MNDITREYQRLNPEDILTGTSGRKHLEEQAKWFSRWSRVTVNEEVEKDNEEYLRRKHQSNDKDTNISGQ